MNKRTTLASILTAALAGLTLLGGCQSLSPPAPSATPLPTQTPTLTPTPGPLELEIDTLLADCGALDEEDRTVILRGKVFLPDGIIYGYEGWYGMQLVSTGRVTVLFQVGEGANMMKDLPPQFYEQDLLIRDNEERLVRQGHEVRVTGRPRYRADSDTRRCELWVDRVESLMPDDVLKPLALNVAELTDDDNINECSDLEFSRQFVGLRGALRVDNFLSICQQGYCLAYIEDASGSMSVKILEGEGANRMRKLPSVFTSSDLAAWDAAGNQVVNSDVNLVGVVHLVDLDVCEMIVYRIGDEPAQ